MKQNISDDVFQLSNISPDFHMVREFQIKLYAKQLKDHSAIFMDCAAASIRDRYVGELVYLPGKTYLLTHKRDSVQRKLFRVLEYLPAESIEDLEVDLVVRLFNPYTEEPRPRLNRLRFPLCLNETLSPQLWHVESVALPKQAALTNDVIVPLAQLPIGTVSVDPSVESPSLQQKSSPRQVSITQSPAPPVRDQQIIQIQSPVRTGKGAEIIALKKQSSLVQPALETPADADLNLDLVAMDQQVEFAASDSSRIQRVLKRWVQLSEATEFQWRIDYKQDNQGFFVRDSTSCVMLDYQLGERNILSTTQSGLLLKEKLTQIALDASNSLESHPDRQLLQYAYEVHTRLQTAPIEATETAAGLLRYLLHFRSPRKNTRKF